MENLSTIASYLIILNLVLKGIFQYLHIRKTDKYSLKSLFSYLTIIPVFDEYISTYKILANIFSVGIFGAIILFLYANQKIVLNIIDEWNNIP